MTRTFSFFLFFFLVYLFILRESECMRGGRGEREGERIPKRLHAISIKPKAGLHLMIPRSWPEPKSRVRCLADHAPRVPQQGASTRTISYPSYFFSLTQDLAHDQHICHSTTNHVSSIYSLASSLLAMFPPFHSSLHHYIHCCIPSPTCSPQAQTNY